MSNGDSGGTRRTGTTRVAISKRVSRPRRPARWRDRLVPYLFIAPFLVSFTLFFFVPSLSSVALSFFRYSGYGQAKFIGLQNYQALFASPSFWQAVGNTVFYWLVPMVPLIGGAFLLALIVSSKLNRLRIYKPLLFVPQIMAPVAAAIVWRVILSNEGLINQLFGLEVNWATDPVASRWAVVLLLVWRGIGWYFVIFLAGLTSIPAELVEAAQLDGASVRQRIMHLYIPLMKPIFLFAIVIDTIGSIQLFTEPNLLLGRALASAGAPAYAAPIMNQVIGNITGGQFGLAAAVGWLMFVAVGVFSFIQFRLLREREN
ncbi:carbohydrate ABC transporter permease [Microbacterium sp. NPDC057407]|uniref:carbohydrate ABC transporter permease n=1 Tax=Microbacterium sp. NPDC057407 TaxID=3346120 RepID=UPI0036729EEE